LDAAALAGVRVPNGSDKVSLSIEAPQCTLKAVVNAKSLRRAVAAIEAAGPDGVVVVLQGKLEGDHIVEAGIAATPKASRQVAQPLPQPSGPTVWVNGALRPAAGDVLTEEALA